MQTETDSNLSSLEQLISSWKNSPYPSIKHSTYFAVYDDLFAHLRGKPCTFIETGVLDGGSLFMWRNWLGDKARIIGVDLNPDSLRWQEHGFEIHIGDQGDPSFWRSFFSRIGNFDALLDDGGHQSFQQIITAYEAIGAAKSKSVIVIEDTAASFMKDFSRHGKNSFLEFAKDSTDILIGKSVDMYPGRFPDISNEAAVDHFRMVHSVRFFNGIVAFAIDPERSVAPTIVRNMPPTATPDLRYRGVDRAHVEWPSLFTKRRVLVRGGMTYTLRFAQAKEAFKRMIGFER